MAYGNLKVDNITFTNGGVDQTITVSGIVQSISGNITATGTIQGAVVVGTTTVSGATVIGNVGQFTTVTGGTAGFTTVTGATVTGTTANFVSGVFTTQVSGAIVRGTTLSGVTITGTALTASSGVFTGNSTAAAFIPTGSSVPSNGVYLPSVNTVGVATNGTGRLFVDADGDLGIGVSSPVHKLHVAGNISTDGVDGRLIGFNLADTFATSTTSAVYGLTRGAIGANTIGLSAFSGLACYTNNTERLRITSAGLVGIGTSSPSARLEVRTVDSSTTIGGSSSVIKLVNDSGVLNSTSGIEFFHSSNTSLNTTRLAGIYGLYKAFNASGLGGDLVFATNTAGDGVIDERMRITSTGNVGIGTTSPGTRLWVSESATGATNGSNDIAVFDRNAEGYIKVLSPNNAIGGIAFGDPDDNFIGAVRYDHSSDSLNLFVNNSERARIDSSGRLLVGTSSANSISGTLFPSLQVEGLSAATSSTFTVRNSNDAGAPVLYLGKSRSTTASGRAVVASGDGLGAISFTGADGTNLIQAASIAAAVDGTPGTNDMPGRLVFSVTADGASSPTEAMRIKNSRILNFANTPVYADNAAAKTGGLVDGDVYRKSDGTLMIVYT